MGGGDGVGARGEGGGRGVKGWAAIAKGLMAPSRSLWGFIGSGRQTPNLSPAMQGFVFAGRDIFCREGI